MQRKRMYSFIILSIVLLVSFKFSFEYLYGFILETKNPVAEEIIDTEVSGKQVSTSAGVIGDKRSKVTTMKGEGLPQKKKLDDPKKSFKTVLTMYNILRIIILIAVFILLYRRYSKQIYALYNKLRNKRLNMNQSFSKSLTGAMDEVVTQQSAESSHINDFTHSHLGRLLYELNQALPPNQKRYPKETVHEWFNRIDFSESSEIYELYRYGDLEDIEENMLQTFSHEVKQFIKQTEGGTYT